MLQDPWEETAFVFGGVEDTPYTTTVVTHWKKLMKDERRNDSRLMSSKKLSIRSLFTRIQRSRRPFLSGV